MADLQNSGFFTRNLRKPFTSISSPVGVRLNWSRKASVPVPSNKSLVFQQGHNINSGRKPAKLSTFHPQGVHRHETVAGTSESHADLAMESAGLNCLLMLATTADGASTSTAARGFKRSPEMKGKRTAKNPSAKVIARSDKKDHMKSRNIPVLTEITSLGSPADSTSHERFLDEATRLSAGSGSEQVCVKSSGDREESTLLFSSTENTLLPSLKTAEEKDLLSDIFRQWQKEINAEYSPKVSVKKMARKKLEAAVNRIKRKSPESGTDDENDVSDSSAELPTLIVHMNHSTLAKRREVSPLSTTRPVKKKLKEKKVVLEEELALQDFLDKLPDNPSHWKINYQDNIRGSGVYSQKRDFRMRENVCHYCGTQRKARHHCLIPCTLCHGDDHPVNNCPYKDTVKTLECARCKLPGHVEAVCPEIWRQFHSTLKPGIPLKRGTPNKPTVHCFNCTKSDHFGFECKRRQFHTPASSLAVSHYDSLSDLEMDGVENPLDEYHEFVRNHLTDETSEYLSGTYEQKKKTNRRKRQRRVVSEPALVGSPKTKARWRRSRKSFTAD
ncbi:hypothetical protein RvY_08562 [Ramazzottius varieornatus]|uniref:Zinc finger CCHC domain-containing protein 7 n=1 Tax=Ramazzottius varieornatus TaxID=947166 RepID=A0A1D1V6B5_RAMVA|nr:hypothetical protein RvY_08562 [Ramazzottius varieornatus]